MGIIMPILVINHPRFGLFCNTVKVKIILARMDRIGGEAEHIRSRNKGLHS